MKTKTFKGNTINVVTLGCSKNVVDSENLITQLKANDFTVTHDSSDDSNIVIVNTCGFIDVAKEESINTILEFAELKKQGGIEKLYATGCLSQRYKDELAKEIPEVDAWFGTLELPFLLKKLNADYKKELVGERWISTPMHYAYLKIAEGCNRTCSFCAIPLMRGKHLSKTIEDLVTEAKNLVAKGVKEIILISQELTYYGLDIYKKRALADLLDALCTIDGLDWIRLHYAYPSKFPIEVFEVMAKQPKVCHYLDVPFQHADDAVLERMKRQTTVDEQRKLIETARKLVPDICIRTTFLVGFPGETEEEFENLCSFIKEMRFDRLGVFKYSHEEGTSAYEVIDDVPDEIKTLRAEKLMDIQQSISYENNLKLVGTKLKVLIDRVEGEYFVGRSQFDSPEVDNEVLIPKEQFCRVGDFVLAKIDDVTEYDLMASKVDN
ncbi:MAG: 30S ribosomal protein S12 methylthiotransferase RimO [Saprospiraceae bacterium]